MISVLLNADDIVRMKAEGIFGLENIGIHPTKNIILGEAVVVDLSITNNLPSDVLCNIACSLHHTPHDFSSQSEDGEKSRSASQSSMGSLGNSIDLASVGNGTHWKSPAGSGRQSSLRMQVIRLLNLLYIL